jgi:hypothetical protein
MTCYTVKYNCYDHLIIIIIYLFVQSTIPFLPISLPMLTDRQLIGFHSIHSIPFELHHTYLPRYGSIMCTRQG